jgi:hypothetical protein
MHVRHLVAAASALLVSVILSVITATGGIGAGLRSSPVGNGPVAGSRAAVTGRGRCVIVNGHRKTPPHVGEPADERSAPRAPGDVSVAIPPTVFIRVAGRRMVITTNTGRPPAPWDGFWVLHRRTATPATPWTRAEVLEACTTRRRP